MVDMERVLAWLVLLTTLTLVILISLGVLPT